MKLSHPTRDLAIINAAGFLRSFSVGLMGVVLGIYLFRAGLSSFAIGLVISVGLAGAALATVLVSLKADQVGRRSFLLILSLLSAVPGIALAISPSLPVLALLAFVGMLNGTGTDRSAASALDQAVIPGFVSGVKRTWNLAWYNILLDGGGALGAMAGGLPILLQRQLSVSVLHSYRLVFLGYFGSFLAVGVLESGESRQRARVHAFAYATGVVCTFLAIGLAILGLRGAGQAVGWGTQLQQPVVVAVLACVLFAVGLSMSGVFQFGTRLGNLGASLTRRGGAAGHFFTGVLAVIVASPCTAPFMGAALAYAFIAPAAHELLVMLTLGIGLALPLTLIGWVPALARLLPKPGRWMETLKQVLAFPMYLSAVWLVWVLAHQRGADAVALVLIAMVLLAAASWWHGRGHPGRGFGHAFTAVLALAAVVSLYGVAHVAPPARVASTDGSVVAFSPAKLQALREAGTPVFVSIGADWCVTCKANEYAVLDTQGFRNLLASTGAVYMKGDWTNEDPAITAFLQQYHSPGVPLYVVYPRGGGEGRALPTVLTASLVRNALVHADTGPAAQ